ncbi:MAG: GTPase Der [Paracoccaceae bacterium]|nr:MAG: GTPase Der [Paracoccaceae bacterium]
MPFTVAIVGRPNVGKSTLFNRLVGRRLAITDDQPGVTRDLREGQARLGDLRFTILDTAGFEDESGDSLTARMRALTERAIAGADLCLFLVDARAGVTPVDEQLAAILRRSGKPVILAANKAEGRMGEAGVLEAFALGFGEVVALSAEHGEGLDELRHRLMPHLAHAAPATRADDAPPAGAEEAAAPAAEGEARPIRIAVIGRPNAGKSTLVNAILGEERMLTGPEAGITRDAIAVDVDWDGAAMRVFDTAGMRRKAKVQDRLERLSVADGLRAIRFAEVVVLLVDAQSPFDSQDLRLADLAEREGRAVVVGISKWDLAEDRQARMAALRTRFEELLPQLRGAPLVFLSAVTGQGLGRLRQAILDAHAVWNRRVPTGPLNRWLADITAAHPPPAPGGRRIRLRYLTQIKTRPPEFLLFCSRPEELPDAYRRYLVNGLRDAFDLPGTPIRLTLRKGENPYAGRGRGGR